MIQSQSALSDEADIFAAACDLKQGAVVLLGAFRKSWAATRPPCTAPGCPGAHCRLSNQCRRKTTGSDVALGISMIGEYRWSAGSKPPRAQLAVLAGDREALAQTYAIEMFCRSMVCWSSNCAPTLSKAAYDRGSCSDDDVPVSFAWA